MWLARLFGGRKRKEEDDEPARFAPPARPVPPVRGSSKVGSAKRGIHANPSAKLTDKVNSGFDPYNSGSFERHNAWERVIRR